MSIFSKLFGKNKEAKQDISSILPKEIFEAGVLELKDIIAPSALKITPRGISLGEKILRSFFVISYPRFLSEGWFSPKFTADKKKGWCATRSLTLPTKTLKICATNFNKHRKGSSMLASISPSTATTILNLIKWNRKSNQFLRPS